MIVGGEEAAGFEFNQDLKSPDRSRSGIDKRYSATVVKEPSFIHRANTFGENRLMSDQKMRTQ